jgi:hypothetical protein
VNGFRLSTAPTYVRVALSLFLIVLGLAYLLGLVNIYDKTHLSYNGVVKSYRGSEEELIYAKEFGDMVSVSHTHLGSWAMMFALVLGVFFFTGYGPKLKGVLGSLPFIFMATDIGSMWLTRYVATGFAWLLMLAGFLLATSFGLIVVLSLGDMWLRRKAAA